MCETVNGDFIKGRRREKKTASSSSPLEKLRFNTVNFCTNYRRFYFVHLQHIDMEHGVFNVKLGVTRFIAESFYFLKYINTICY